MSSLLISMLSLERFDCSLPRHVAARGSDPCKRKQREKEVRGLRLNGFVGLSLNDRTILFLVITLDKTVSFR